MARRWEFGRAAESAIHFVVDLFQLEPGILQRSFSQREMVRALSRRHLGELRLHLLGRVQDFIRARLPGRRHLLQHLQKTWPPIFAFRRPVSATEEGFAIWSDET